MYYHPLVRYHRRQKKAALSSSFGVFPRRQQADGALGPPRVLKASAAAGPKAAANVTTKRCMMALGNESGIFMRITSLWGVPRLFFGGGHSPYTYSQRIAKGGQADPPALLLSLTGIERRMQSHVILPRQAGSLTCLPCLTKVTRDGHFAPFYFWDFFGFFINFIWASWPW